MLELKEATPKAADVGRTSHVEEGKNMSRRCDGKGLAVGVKQFRTKNTGEATR